jgi:hypothetical protein
MEGGPSGSPFIALSTPPLAPSNLPRSAPIDDSHMEPESSQHALIISPWQPVYHVQNQVVLYNSTSKALTIASNVPPWHENIEEQPQVCPFCHRPLDEYEEHSPMNYTPVPNYFHLLALHNESRSRPLTPPSLGDTRPPLGAETMAEGYFDAFFREEYKLGMGANGSVFLCQHVLDGNPLGHFAVKKIAVGSSHDYLVKILREVKYSLGFPAPELTLSLDRCDCLRV